MSLFCCCSVAQLCLTLPPHGLQHANLPCPSQSPSLLKFSALNRWCHPTTSSSVVLFSSCLQSFPASGSFPMRQLFVSGGQSIGASTSASVLPMNIQDWFPLRDHQGSPLGSFKTFLYILDNSPLADVSFAPNLWLSSHHLDSVFCREVFNFNKVQFRYF